MAFTEDATGEDLRTGSWYHEGTRWPQEHSTVVTGLTLRLFLRVGLNEQYDDVLMGKSIFEVAVPDCHERIKAAVQATLVRYPCPRTLDNECRLVVP